MYSVTDASGKELKSYMANDAKVNGIAGLPTTEADDIPDYFWKPNMDAITDVMAGKKNDIVENDPQRRGVQVLRELRFAKRCLGHRPPRVRTGCESIARGHHFRRQDFRN